MSTVDLGDTFGAALIGVLLSACLFGALTVQVHSYFRDFTDDSKWTRALVWALYALEVATTAISFHFIYYYVIISFGNAPALEINNWSFDAQPTIEPFIAFGVQMYYVRRAWKMDPRGTIMAYLIILMGVVQLLMGIGCGMLVSVVLHNFSQFPHYRWAVGVWLGAAALADILVTLWLVRTLWRSKSGFNDTDTIVTKLIVYTLNTGLLTALCAILDLVCYVTMNNLIHFAFNFMLTKLYMNSLMGSLNFRREVRTTGSSMFTSSGPRMSTGVPLTPMSDGFRDSRRYTIPRSYAFGTDAEKHGPLVFAPPPALQNTEKKGLGSVSRTNTTESMMNITRSSSPDDIQYLPTQRYGDDNERRARSDSPV